MDCDENSDTVDETAPIAAGNAVSGIVEDDDDENLGDIPI